MSSYPNGLRTNWQLDFLNDYNGTMLDFGLILVDAIGPCDQRERKIYLPVSGSK